MDTDRNLTASIPSPAGTPIRLAVWIRRSLAHDGPGRKLHYTDARRGKLRTIRPGGRWLYVTPEDYADWLNRCRIETSGEREARLVRDADAIHREAQAM